MHWPQFKTEWLTVANGPKTAQEQQQQEEEQEEQGNEPHFSPPTMSTTSTQTRAPSQMPGHATCASASAVARPSTSA